MKVESPPAALRVLLIEDSEDDAALVERALRRAGFVPELWRVDSEAGLRAAVAQGPWDLVLSDHHLPGFSSADALELVRSGDRDVPFIIVSGMIPEDTAVAAMRLGAQDYIFKDNLSRLAPAVQRELAGAARRRAHREAEHALQRLALYDPVTGIANRQELERRLAKLVRSLAAGEEHALLYVDLDQFKVVNDLCGHAAGDALLGRVAQTLRAELAETETLARLGGDEFAVLAPGRSIAAARETGERLLRALAEVRFAWGERTFTVGASIGIAAVNAATRTATEALRRADLACLAAKDLGRNRVHVFEERDARLAERHGEMQWVARIMDALEEDRFEIALQEIRPLGGAGPVHAEVLVRLRERDGTIVPPAAFVGAAERYNLMAPIDRLVVMRVAQHVGALLRSGGTADGSLFVNLSGTTLAGGDLVPWVQEALGRERVPHAAVGFEITETAAIADFESAAAFVQSMRAAGAPISLDDFGTGLSSFGYLRALPVDYLKIDGVFIRGMADDAMNRAIVEAIRGIARVAGIRTIAESVETEAVRARVASLGIDYGQGYLLDRPQIVSRPRRRG